MIFVAEERKEKRMRLIDADALMEEFAKFVRASNNSDFAPIPTWNDAVSLAGSAPTISPDMAQVLAYECGKDSVEVVRCKECKRSTEYSDKQFTCRWFDTLVFPNDFCSNGERRSE